MSVYMRKKLIAAFVLLIIVIAAGVHFWPQPASKNSTANKPAANVHLTNYTNNDGPDSTVVLSGVIGDFGQATRSTGQQSIMTLHLSHGTFQLDITNLAKHFSTLVGQATFNQLTCSGNVSAADSVPIVAGSGTGTYKDIKGNFSLSMDLDEVVPMQTGCSGNSPLLNQAIITSGWGNVSL